MKDLTLGSLVLFIEDFSDDTMQEGYLLGNSFEQSPGEFWSITKNREIIDNKLYRNINNHDIFKDTVEIKNIRAIFIKKYSDKTILEFNKIVKCLNTYFIRKNVNYYNEMWQYFVEKNSILKIWLKSIGHFLYNPIMIFINVCLGGIIRLVFGSLIDYFDNRYNIFKIKKLIKNKNRNNSLKKLLLQYSGIQDNLNDDNELEEKLEKLEEYRANIYDTLIAILALIISIISIIISINSKQ